MEVLIALKESAQGIRLTFLDEELREELCGDEGGELRAPAKDQVIALAISRLKAKGMSGKLRIRAWPEEAPEPKVEPRVSEVRGDKARVLKPGFLVVLHTKVRGGVSRTTEVLSKKQVVDGVATREVKKVTELVQDPEELARAENVRSSARSMITSVTTHSDFGELCPTDREAELDEAIVSARQMIEAHNATAKTTSVYLYVLKGHIAQSDQEAVAAIGSQLRDLVGTMRDAIAKGDVKEIRKAASEAKKLGSLLDEGAAKRVSAAVEEARKVARDMVRELDDGGDIANVIERYTLNALDESRFAFLDIDVQPVKKDESSGAPSTPTVQLDLDVA